MAYSLYFFQMLLLVNVGNNILQSILAGQVLKNSNRNALKEMLEGLKYQCPHC